MAKGIRFILTILLLLFLFPLVNATDESIVNHVKYNISINNLTYCQYQISITKEFNTNNCGDVTLFNPVELPVGVINNSIKSACNGRNLNTKLENVAYVEGKLLLTECTYSICKSGNASLIINLSKELSYTENNENNIIRIPIHYRKPKENLGLMDVSTDFEVIINFPWGVDSDINGNYIYMFGIQTNERDSNLSLVNFNEKNIELLSLNPLRIGIRDIEFNEVRQLLKDFDIYLNKNPKLYIQQQDTLYLNGKIDRLVEIRNDHNQSIYIESSNDEIKINDVYIKGAKNIPMGGMNTLIDKVYPTNISKSSCSFPINQFPFKCEEYSGKFLFNNYFNNDSKEYAYEIDYTFLIDNGNNNDLKVELNIKNSQLCMQPKKIKILPGEYLDYSVAYDENGNPVFLPFFQRMQFIISPLLLNQNTDYCMNSINTNKDFIVFNNPPYQFFLPMYNNIQKLKLREENFIKINMNVKGPINQQELQYNLVLQTPIKYKIIFFIQFIILYLTITIGFIEIKNKFKFDTKNSNKKYYRLGFLLISLISVILSYLMLIPKGELLNFYYAMMIFVSTIMMILTYKIIFKFLKKINIYDLIKE